MLCENRASYLSGMCRSKKLYLKIVYEPPHEKTNNLKPQISCAVTAQLISAFVFRCRDNTILLIRSEISRFYPASVTLQAGLCQT